MRRAIMATLDAAEHDQDWPSVAPTRTERGLSDATDFAGFSGNAPASMEETLKSQDSDAPARKTSSHQEHPEPAEEISPIRSNVTEEFDEQDFPLPPAKRTRSAPAQDSRRPKIGPRASTLLGARKREVTNTRMNGGKRDPFQYTFDPVSSDSDSSSSSDDEAPAPAKRSENAAQQSAPMEEQQTEDTMKDDGTTERTEHKQHRYSRFAIGNDFFKTKGKVSRRDGRLKISINETANSGYIAKALGQSIRNHLAIPNRDHNKTYRPESPDEEDDEEANAIAEELRTKARRPRLNIVIMVIGSRGDIQPFLKIAKILKTFGHRVRIASHPTFRDFVEKDVGLEFFSVGGDPSELMAFMVKNPGLIPSMSTVWEGEIQKRRAAMAEMFEGFWRACINATDDEKDEANLKLMGDKPPFIADAIIANPPSMAHVHIAERLGVPLHMMFTFPYSPTTEFPHPLANIKMRKSNVDAGYVNFMSYPLVEMMTWQGLGDIVNRFRENTLRLEPVSSLWAPGALYRMKVPYTYLWSPGLVPKPPDWGPEIDLSGFVFLDLAQDFKPPKELSDFLKAGDPPVYIGFGSIVVDDPNTFTDMIFKAVEIAGVRALVSKGWGGFGSDNSNTPENIFMLENTPHDWLFPQVKAVVHHGGAGTTAIGLKCGKPTMIVPFFGDQPFWGAMVAEARAGAHECIPYKKLTAKKLAEGIKQCLTEESQENVQTIADSIAKEGDGAENAVISFHRSLPLAGRHSMRCSILQDRAAVWDLKKSSLRLSALAAELLCQENKIKWNQLILHRDYEWNDFDGPGEPLSGTVGALSDSLYGIGEGFGMVPVRIARHIRKHEEHERRKRHRQKRRVDRERQKRERATGNETDHFGNNDGKDGQADGDRPPRQETGLTLASTLSADPSEPLPLTVIEDLNWGLKRAGAAILTMPNDLAVAIAQGFHNAPRLYGDATVRKPIKITGVRSGFVAARKEFAYGMYDGWTGLVKQPKGDWEDGDTLASKFAGLGTGIGKGIGGFVIKNTNAVWAPGAFIFKGLIKHIERITDGPGSEVLIRKAHIIQGQIDLRNLKEQDSGDQTNGKLHEVQELVDHGWSVYEDMWNTAHQHFGPAKGNLVARYKMRKERKRWEDAGALSNVKSAEQALQARKEGQDLEKLFAKRNEEMRIADKPRAGALDQPKTFEENAGIHPNGQIQKISISPPSKQRTGSDNSSPSQIPGGDGSETTDVTTPEDDGKENTMPKKSGLGLGDDLKKRHDDESARSLKDLARVT